MDDREQVVAGHARRGQLGVGHGGTSGLQFHTTSASTGGSASGRSATSPSRLMLIVRGIAAGQQVGAAQRVVVDERVLPRADAAGEAAAAVLPRADERRQARPACGRTSPRSRGARRRSGCGWRPGGSCRSRGRARSMTVASTPQVGRRSRRRPVGDVGDELGEADACGRRPIGWSTSPSRTRTCIIASIRAMSVPGSGCTNSSAASAVSVRIGSITTTLAPSARARLDRRPEVAVGEAGVGAPDAGSACEWRSSSGSRPRPLPLVIAHAVPDGRPADRSDEQAARRGALKKRPSMPIIASRLWLPASLNGRIASAAVAAMTAWRRVGDLGQRVVPRDLLELARSPSGRRGAAGAGPGRGCRRGRGSG